MNLRIGFHPLVQKDFNELLEYYEAKAGAEVADRFETEFQAAIEAIKEAPKHFSFYQKQRRYRRFLLPTFPHLILYRESGTYVRIMVLKHVKRAPSFGLRRR